MSQTLMEFLQRNQHYDSSRASLMLVATAALALSNDDDSVSLAMGRHYKQDEHNEHSLLWPVECLMAIGVSRGDTLTPIRLLNATIPDELRRRQATPMTYKTISRDLISVIIQSCSASVDYLMDMVENSSNLRFWDSLDDNAKQEYSLIDFDGKFPLLDHYDVRQWLLKALHLSLEAELSHGKQVFSTAWIKHLVSSCLTNGKIHIQDLLVSTEEEKRDTMSRDDWDKIEQYMTGLASLRRVFSRAEELDFNILIPCMLILNQRNDSWRCDARYSTSEVLNTICYWAGRPNVTSFAKFDSHSLMRQCAILNNIEAGSNLVGGEDGLVLQCCDILIQKGGLSMDEAENYLISDDLPTPMNKHHDDFIVDDLLQRLLWLLQEHVLSVRTYGDFENPETRGRIDPVFAAKMCLKTWWLLTQGTRLATLWLVEWLRTRLQMSNAVPSKQRLVCAALGRALLWPPLHSSGPFMTLACKMEIPSSFAIELCQASVGLIESVPTEKARTRNTSQDVTLKLNDATSPANSHSGNAILHLYE